MFKRCNYIYIAVFILLLVLPTMSNAQSSIPSVKMLATSSCPVCHLMLRIFQQINLGLPGQIDTSEVDLAKHPEVAQQYNIRYTPTLIFFDAQGNVIGQRIGYMTMEQVLDVFKAAGIEFKR